MFSLHAVSIVEALVQLFQDFEAHEQDPSRVAVNPNPLREALSRKGLDFKMGASLCIVLCISVAMAVDLSGPGLQSLSHRRMVGAARLGPAIDSRGAAASYQQDEMGACISLTTIKNKAACLQEPAGSSDDFKQQLNNL